MSEDEIDTRGLDIVTTINQRDQEAAVQAVDNLPDDRPENNRVSLVSIDPSSGAIVALYGGADFVSQPRNAATQDARPGRVDVQAVRAGRRARAGHRPVRHLPGPREAEHRRLGRQELRREQLRAGQPGRGDGELHQHRLRPAQRGRRTEEHHRRRHPRRSSARHPGPRERGGQRPRVGLAARASTWPPSSPPTPPRGCATTPSSSPRRATPPGTSSTPASGQGRREFDDQVMADATYAMQAVIDHDGAARTVGTPSAVRRPARPARRRR